MSAENMVTVEVWVIVDEDGNVVCHEDRESAAQRYVDDIGGDDCTARRVVKVTLKVPTPKPVELSGVVAEEPDGGELVAQ